MPATEEEKTLNKAVNEAVEHLAGRQTPSGIISGPAASELWPVYDPPHQDSPAEEDAAAPADAFDESSEDSTPQRPALWPVDELPETALTEEEDLEPPALAMS